MRTALRHSLFGLGLVLLLAAGARAEERLSAADARAVLAVLQGPDGQGIGGEGAVARVLDAVAALPPPEMPVIKKLVQTKSLLGGDPAYAGDPHLVTVEKTIMRTVIRAALAARGDVCAELAARGRTRLFAIGDVGSWEALLASDALLYETDMDFTLFSALGDTSFETDFAQRFRDRIGSRSERVLPETCGVVVTRPGGEAAAGVFVTRGGILWARQTGMRFRLLGADGTVGREIPFDDLGVYAFDAALAVDPDLSPFVGEKGRIRDMAEDSAEFRRFVDVIVRKYPNLGYEKMTAGKATGGVLDMQVHNLHEAIRASELGWEGRAARSTKYGLRGQEIFLRGMAEAKGERAAWLALLGDDNQRFLDDLVQLERVRHDPAAFNALFAKLFGPPTTDAMKGFTERVQAILTKQSSISHTYHMKQIVGIEGVEGKAARSSLLAAVLDDYRKIEADMVRHDAPDADLLHVRGLIQEAETIRILNDSGDLVLLDELRGLFRKTTPGARRGLLGFFRQTGKGQELGEILKPYLDEEWRISKRAEILNEGAVLDYVNSVLVNPALERAALVKDRVDLGVEGIQFTLACAKAYVEADLREGSAEWQTAIAVAREAALRRWPLVAVGLGAYAAAEQGDLPKMAQLIAMLICPWSAIPETVKGLGEMGKDVAIHIAFEGLLDSLYGRATFDPDPAEAGRRWQHADDVLGKARFRLVSVRALGTDYPGEEGVRELIDDILLQGRADTWAPSDGGNELAGGWAEIWNRGTVPAIRELLKTGRHTLFKGDVGMAAILEKLRENETMLRRYEKNPALAVWLGTVIPLGYDMRFVEDRTAVADGGWGSLPRGGAEEKTLDQWLANRRELKQAALDRLARLIVASFEARRRTAFVQEIGTQSIDSALRERLEPLAAQLHVDVGALVKNAQEAYAEAVASLPDDRKSKAAIVVDQWVGSYEQVVAIKQEVLSKALSLGCHPGYLRGPAGPLSRTPPFVLRPDEDLAVAQRVQRDVEHLPASVFALWNAVAGTPELKGEDDPAAVRALERARFDILVLELRFAGVQGVDWGLWRRLEGEVFADDAFAALVVAKAKSAESWGTWWASDAAQRDLLLEQLGWKAAAFNAALNELRVARQTAVTLAPQPLVVVPGGEATLTLRPKHTDARFQWRLKGESPGLTLAPESGRVERGEAVEIVLRAAPTARAGVQTVRLVARALLRGDLPAGTAPPAEPEIEILVSVGPPPRRAAEVRVFAPNGRNGLDPCVGARVLLRRADGETVFDAAREAGLYRADGVAPGAGNLVVARQGKPEHVERVVVPIAAEGDGAWRHDVRLAAEAGAPPPPEPVELVLETHRVAADGSPAPYEGDFHAVVTRGGTPEAEADGSGGRLALSVAPGGVDVEVRAEGMKPWRRSADLAARTTLRVLLERDPLVELPPGRPLLLGIAPREVALEAGQAIVLTASAWEQKGPVLQPARPAAGTISWFSSDPTAVSVEADGVRCRVTARRPASRARVTARYVRGADTVEASSDVVVLDPAGMDFRIRIEPDGDTFPFAAPLTFRAVTTTSPPPEWRWYVGSIEAVGDVVTITPPSSGTWTVRLVATHPVTGTTDAVSRTFRVADPELPPEDVVEPGGAGGGAGGGVDERPEAEPAPGVPLARRRNDFRFVQAGGRAVRVEARGWRDMALRFSAWSPARDLPANDDAVLTVGEQDDGFNTGWVVFSPSGTGRLEFHALGFDFGSLRAKTTYSGTVDLRGRRFAPGTLKVVGTASRAAEFECRTADGTLCRFRIWKIPKVESSSVTLQGGVEILEWIPPRMGSGAGAGAGGGGPVSPANVDLVAVGRALFEARNWQVSPEPTEFPLQGTPGLEGRSFDVTVVTVSAKGQGDDTGVLRLCRMKNAEDAAAYCQDLVAMSDRGGRRSMKVRLRGLPAFYKTVPPNEQGLQAQTLAWSMDDLICVLNLRRRQVRENLQQWAEDFHDRVRGAQKEGPATGASVVEETGPEIMRLAWKSAVWPVRLQDGVLEIRGCGYPGYTWRERWIRLSGSAKDFTGGASAQGPIVAFTEDGKRWKVVELQYDTGARTNERTFDAPVFVVRGGSYGSIVAAGGKQYDLSWGQCREVDPKTGLYVR